MKAINRFAITLVPKDAFTNWLNEVLDEEDLDIESLLDQGFQTFLLPVFDDDCDEELATYIETCSKDMIAAQLMAWEVDEAEWPEELNVDLLNEWFMLDFSDLVLDLVTE
jgi:hypothetical protein